MSQTATREIAPVLTARAAPAGPPRTQRLNIFQQLMRLWTDLAPYNAGQVMQVSGGADEGAVERWHAAAEAVLAETGLGRPRFAADQKQVTFEPAGFEAIERIAGGPGKLQEYVCEELNRGFGEHEFPIRFFIMSGAEAGQGGARASHYFGAIYNHWIADSRAMRELMQRIFQRYRAASAAAEAGGGGAGAGSDAGGDGKGALPALTVENPSIEELFGHHIGRLRRLAALRQSVRNLWRHRRAFRLNLADPLDFRSRVIYRQLAEGLIHRVHQAARGQHASVNDAFLAVLSQTMGEFTAEQRYKPRPRRFHLQRDQVGLGTIVDIRDAAAQPMERVFGLYLSSYTVVLKEPERRAVPELIGEVAARTRQIKKTNGAVRGFAALWMARRWWDWYGKPKYRAQLFHRNVPVTAGISNVNMSGSWVDPAVEPALEHGEGEGIGYGVRRGEMPVVLDYLRVSPTGPLLPLVFTLTTIGSRLSLFVTYRTTTFTDEQAQTIVDDFVQRLNAIGGAIGCEAGGKAGGGR